MITLGTAGNTIQGVTTAAATAITYTFFGDEFASGTTDSFKVLAQGQLPTSAAALYTVPATTQTIVKAMQLFNTTGAIVNFTLYVNGAVAANSIGSINIPANGTAIWESNGWTVRDVNGATFTTANLTLTGDVTGSGSGAIATTLATVNANVGTFAVNTVNAKGLTTAASALTGDVTSSGAATTLATVNASPGSTGDASHTSTIVTNGKGLVTSNTSVPIAITSGAVSGLTFFATLANLSGDVTTAGSGVATLTTVNANVGSFGTASNVSTITVNAKGLITAASNTPIAITSGAVSGLTFFATLANLSGDVTTSGSGVTTLATVNANVGTFASATFNAKGLATAAGPLTGDATTSGAALTLATVNANVGTFGDSTHYSTFTVNAKGLITAASQLTFPAAGITALTGDVTASGAGSVVATLATVNSNVGTFGDVNHVPTFTVNGKGLVTAASQTILPPKNGWIDVTNQAAPVNTTNSAATNVTNINAILSAAPAGSTIYFPGGTYNFNAAWTMPAKAFTFQGQGSQLSGGYTILAWTSNVAGTFITLNNTTWYTQFFDLTFVSAGVTQTAGAVVDVNGNAGCNFFRCTFGQTGGGFLFNVLTGGRVGTAGSINDQSWNQATISNCFASQYKGTGIFCNSGAVSLIIENCTFNGQWGPTTGTPAAAMAVAGVEGRWVGALQIIGCDFIGHVNNLLLDPVTANSEVCASVFVTNCYFDNAATSSVNISGTGATVRCRFDTCSFTCAGTNFTTVGTGGAAVQMSSTFAAGSQGIDFVNCNFLNTFGMTNASGLFSSSGADFSVVNCRVAGWTNGLNITGITAGGTKPLISGNTIGPSGGIAGNTTGIIFTTTNAYGSMNVIGNQLAGNTLAISDTGAAPVTGGQKVYSANSGLWTASRTAGATATTATTAEVYVTGATLPANGALVNQAFRVVCMFGTSATGTSSVRLKYGVNFSTADTTLVTATVVATAIGTFRVEFLVEVTAIGATGTLRVGTMQALSANAIVAGTFPNVAVSTPTVNTTVNNFLGLSFSASAGTLTNIISTIEPITQC